MTITSGARIDRILYQYQDAVLKYGDDFDLVVAAIEAALPDVDIDEIVLALRNLAVSFENWAKARRKAERGVTDSNAIKENEAGQISPWTEAFYDRDYGRDQTRRMVIYDGVVDFLQSIGCRVSWTAGHDGSDFNHDYGIFIASVTYQGKEFEHNPCYQIRYELPTELTEKLDAKFGTVPGAQQQ
jgi:hypothetical protein